MLRLYTCLLLIVFALAALPLHAQTLSKADQERNTLRMAESLQRGGDLTKAADAYKQLADTGSLAGQIALAKVYRVQGKPLDAVNVLREADTQKPGNPRVLLQLGYALIATKQYEEAVNVFDKLITIQPDNALAHNGKGVAFDSSGNHVAAQEIYQMALALAPDSPAIKNNVALSKILNDQLDEAIALLEPMVTRPDSTPTMRQNLALAYGMKGDVKKARELNLKDVTAEQAEENLQFYKHYAKLKKEHKTVEVESAFDDENTPPVTLIGAKETPDTGVAENKEETPKSSPPKVESKEATPKPSSPKEAAPAAGKISKKKKPSPQVPAPSVEPNKGEESDKTEESEPLFGKDAVYTFPSK